jgi:NAD(P)-dependent dehydrogenase (short-subunit alcohol dehydrogenase family)
MGGKRVGTHLLFPRPENLKRRQQATGNLTLTVVKLNSRGAFHFSQAVLPLLLDTLGHSPEFPPTLIFTSATAAMKGSALCAAFATGKFAMRALAQSLAREFGPKGIHVNHAIIDGVIDIERTKSYKFDHPDAKIKPEAVRVVPAPAPAPASETCQMDKDKSADPECWISDRRLVLVLTYSAQNLFHQRD